MSERVPDDERERLRDQLQQSQRLEALGQLAAGIAHEINTPAQYVGDNVRFLDEAFAGLARLLACHRELLAEAERQGFAPELSAKLRKLAEELDADYLEEEAPRALEQSAEGVARVAEIVNAMKIYAHPGVTEMTAFDLGRAVETTITVARSEWKTIAEVEVTVEPELPLVQCIPGEINQAILNLVTNAAHAVADVVEAKGGGRGRIAIGLRRDGDEVIVEVSDSGGGIPAENAERVFEPFFTTKPVGRGSGQGLSIARSIVVDHHGGSLDFESNPGEGATFRIRLPIDGQGNKEVFS